MKNKLHPFRKKWGQNFIADTNLLDRIVRTLELDKNNSILEIGPGDGLLTKKIFSRVKEMAVVEIDPLLVKHLSIRSDFDGLEIVHGDILRQDIENLTVTNPVRIIGNIPYNITSSIIFWLIEQLDYWEDAHIMLQKEVADRLVAKVGTKQYGRLTIVKSAFLMRRKMLRNSLSGFKISDKVKQEIDFSRRPETLSIKEFAKLLCVE